MSVSTFILVTVALASVLSLGFGILSLLLRSIRLYATETWAVAYVLGTGAGAMLWFVLSPIYAVVPPIVAVTAVATVAGIAGMVRARQLQPSTPHSPAEGLLTVLLIAQCGLLMIVAMRTPLGWDALFNFEMKARLALENVPAGRLPLAYFSDSTRNWSHPQYPLVVPFAELWIYSWLGRVDQSAIKILFPLFYISLMAIVCGLLRRAAGRVPALACAIALGWLPPIVLQPGAVSGYADVPLAAAFAGAVSFAAIGLRTGRHDAIWLGSALSAVAAWTKTEGIVLAVSLGVVAFVANRLSSPPSRVPFRTMAALLYVPLLAVAPWMLLQQAYGQAAGDFGEVSMATTAANVHRLPAIATLVGRELARPGHWAMVWPAFVASIWLMVRRREASASDWLMAGAVLLPVVIYSVVFVYSSWERFDEHMGFSLSRLLVALAPVALIFAMKQIWPRTESASWA